MQKQKTTGPQLLFSMILAFADVSKNMCDSHILVHTHPTLPLPDEGESLEFRSKIYRGESPDI